MRPIIVVGLLAAVGTILATSPPIMILPPEQCNNLAPGFFDNMSPDTIEIMCSNGYKYTNEKDGWTLHKIKEYRKQHGIFY
ncbi:unnamed protein product [Heligmosomoides polygyrus]|uniref:Secreted protein n=1 Tax=Heligmosomoides polygyrus TaxID=6339 RepID=A0A183FQZ0_HELPZ|nr:unnamed protein product [Heligmosomoides polygyrus]